MAGFVFASAALLVEQTTLEGHEGLVVALRCLLHASDELSEKERACHTAAAACRGTMNIVKENIVVYILVHVLSHG